MQKVLFYTDTPLIGGAENQMLLLAKFLPKDKYETTVACSSYQALNPWCQKLMELGVNMQRLKVFHKHDPRHFLYLKKMLPSFDLMHIHVWNPASCRYALLAGSKIPVVITEHDPFALHGLKGWLKNKLLKNVKRIITASQAAKKMVIQQEASLEEKTTVVPNGINIDEWKKETELDARTEFRRKNFGITGNEKIILCVAELHERKGQKYLISAIQKVLTEFPSVKLALAGDGPKRRYYEKSARPLADKVLFLGRRKDIAKLMAAADLFVLPSVREAFGLVILEAAIAGLPIIATNVGGIPEIIENEKTGLIVEPQNSEVLAKAILDLLQNPLKANTLAKQAISKVEKNFSAKTMAEKTAEVYDNVLS